jgi:SAM-dependent methyltransferase
VTRKPEVPFPGTIEELGTVGDAGALAHYSDPSYYTKTYGKRRHDVDYYVRVARKARGPVLEYGVGNGRVALAVAGAGVSVFGVDLSRTMLDDLEKRLAESPPKLRERIELRHGDMREVRLGRRFPLVIAPFNALLHLYERSDFEAFFARVLDHLEPAGRFVFDFSVPQPDDLARDPERWFGAPRFRHPASGELVRYDERFDYDQFRQLLLVTTRFSPEHGRPWTIPLTHRQLFPREVEALLHYNGFTDIEFTSDFSDHPADRHTDSAVVSCRPARVKVPRG